MSISLKGDLTFSLLDDEWHTIRFEREGAVVALYVDNKPQNEDRTTDALEYIKLQKPIYIGGLPTDLVPFAARILPVNIFKFLILITANAKSF